MQKVEKYELHKIQEQIDAYRRGTLSEDEIDSLWAEIVEYPENLDYLINTVNLEALASELGKESDLKTEKHPGKENQIFIPQMFRNWGRVAAVFVIVAGVLSTIYFVGTGYIFEPDPLGEIEMDSFRSSEIPTSVFDYELQRAINHAAVDEYDQALAKLGQINEVYLTTEQKVTLRVNKGSILYNKGDFGMAAETFAGILSEYDELHVLTEERVHWFLANSYLQLGEDELALEHIQKTYDLNGAYRRLAERFLD